MSPQPQPLLTTQAVAGRLGIGRDTVWRGLGRVRAAGAFCEKTVNVGSPDPHASAKGVSGQLSSVDPVTNRLLVELEDRGDLGDRQELIVSTRQS